MTSDPANLAPEAREQEIERLAQELGRLIQDADPERREDLKELAFALIREEFIHKAGDERSAAGADGRLLRPANRKRRRAQPTRDRCLDIRIRRGAIICVWTGGLGFDGWRSHFHRLGSRDQLD